MKKYTPPLNRQLFHDEVNIEQKNILKFDGKDDNKLSVSPNEEINFLLTKAVTDKIDCMQYQIEVDSSLTSQKKIYYVRKIASFLGNWLKGWKSGQADPINLPAIIQEYDDCIQLDKKGMNIAGYFENLSYENGTYILKSTAFDNNPGYKTAKDLLIKKYCILHPDQIFQILRENPDVPFADSLIRTVAHKYPDKLYNYAAANNKLAYIIRNIVDDPFVKAVSRMAKSKSGRLYFPFLDNIVNGKISFEDVDNAKDDSIAYYKLLVKTKLDYVQRAINKDTAFGFNDLSYMIERKASDVFVNTINGLHEIDDPNVRFKIIQPLNAQELYYLAVSTDGIIYTSSFVKGVYPLMMSKVNQKGDSLLRLVMFDKYRKFIKMAAGYNTLSNFMSSFSGADDANALMRAFVGRLERTNSLEDGVDVADSYASIEETIKPVANEMLNNVRVNFERNKEQNNKRGMVMYDLLYKLFLSADSTSKIDLSAEFGIPPVYSVPFKALAIDSGKVVMQVFFYGDKDGKNIFEGFKKMFAPAIWKIDNSNPNWITITSLKGKPVSI